MELPGLKPKYCTGFGYGVFAEHKLIFMLVSLSERSFHEEEDCTRRGKDQNVGTSIGLQIMAQR